MGQADDKQYVCLFIDFSLNRSVFGWFEGGLGKFLNIRLEREAIEDFMNFMIKVRNILLHEIKLSISMSGPKEPKWLKSLQN